MKLQFDFAAAAGKHFGVFQPVGDQVLALSGAVDVWSPALGDGGLIFVDGRVSEWRGRRSGRVLSQSVPGRRPAPEAGLLRMSSAAEGVMAQLDLAGAAIGVRSALTVACHAQIHPGQVDQDLQYIWGSAVADAMFRMSYRSINGNRYLRIQIGTAATNLDVPLPANWSGVVGAVVGLGGGSLSMHLTTGGSGSRALASVDVRDFAVGGGTAGFGAGGLRGLIGNFGIWSRAMSDDERTLLLRWVA